MSKQLSQSPHEQPQKLALLQRHDDPHYIAIVERFADTHMQIDDDVIESDDLWNPRH